jgi:pyridoxal phosphate enzyme (YggS family)
MYQAERIAANLAEVRERIAVAARAAGRSPGEVRLVAVTKYVDAATTRLLVDAGCTDLGESRPQQLWEKSALLNDAGIRWHLIGHLQRNKVRRTVPLVYLVHSGDGLRLLEELDREAASLVGRPPLPVLLEVNVSGEAAKHGFAPDDLPRHAAALAALGHLEIRGLMAMAGLDDDPTSARRDFAGLRELRDRLRREWGGRFALDELSMGMSGDYEAAVAEGATLVRVGSALFQGVV